MIIRDRIVSVVSQKRARGCSIRFEQFCEFIGEKASYLSLSLQPLPIVTFQSSDEYPRTICEGSCKKKFRVLVPHRKPELSGFLAPKNLLPI